MQSSQRKELTRTLQHFKQRYCYHTELKCRNVRKSIRNKRTSEFRTIRQQLSWKDPGCSTVAYLGCYISPKEVVDMGDKAKNSSNFRAEHIRGHRAVYTRSDGCRRVLES